MSEPHIAALAPLATQVTFEESEVVLEEGQRSNAFYVVTQGSVAVELRTPRYVVCVDVVAANSAFGWSALLDHHDTTFQVRAREHTTALRLDGPQLRALCRHDSGLAADLLHRTLYLVAGRVRATEIRFAEMCGVKV